jgi:hypothetical protein
MESTKPYQDGMDIKKKSPDFELLKKLSAKGIKIEPAILKLCKKLLVFVSLIMICGSVHAETDLKCFTASLTGAKVKLFWKMNVESNINYFSIERSADGKFFETVGMIKASDNATAHIDYSFIDKDYYNHVVYYRLKQKDNNGTERILAGIIALQIETVTKETVIYPAPKFPSKIYIDASKINSNKLIVDVMDSDGQKLANKELDKSQNEYAVELKSAYAIQKGEYTVSAFYSNYVIKSRLAIQDPSMNLSANALISKRQPFTLK